MPSGQPASNVTTKRRARACAAAKAIYEGAVKPPCKRSPAALRADSKAAAHNRSQGLTDAVAGANQRSARSAVWRIHNQGRTMKKLIALALVLSLALVGVAQGASSSASKMREVERLCVWVEKTGTPDTRFDLKSVKAYTAVQKLCIVGKRGKSGKHGVRGKAGAKGATGLTGLQGLLGPQGLPGAIGPLGPTGPAGLDGLDGAEGGAGANGVDGLAGAKGEQGEQGPQGEQGEQGPAGPAGSNGTNGTNGVDGIDGEDGEDGLNGSSIVTVAGDFIAGEKTFTVDCPPGSFSLSGGYDIQGSVTASYRSDSTGDPAGNTSWTITQTSGNTGSGKAYVYCVAGS